jgi:hypothetical protein
MSKQDAFARLEAFEYGIPFDAIRFLYEHEADAEIVEKIRFALEHAFDDDLYYDDEFEDYSNAPLWYAIVAENHLDISYLPHLIRIFTDPEEDNDFLFDQAVLVVEKMFDRYGEEAVGPVMEAIDRMVDEGKATPWMYLLTCFPYADSSYAEQIIAWLEHPGMHWREPMVVHLADAPQFSAALPTLRRMLAHYEKELAGLPEHDFKRHILIELKATIESLESGKAGSSYGGWEPFFKTRKSWDKHYAQFSDRFEPPKPAPPPPAPKKSVKIGRNDPCPCGSGKKYKKCCWGKGVDF